VTGKESDARTMKPLSFWQSAAFQYANPKAWMLAAATAGVVHDEPSDVRQYRNYCHRVFDCGNRQSYHLDVGWLRPATLAQRRLANANF
jgi:hypothetical protein